jgi:hypothetical protein
MTTTNTTNSSSSMLSSTSIGCSMAGNDSISAQLLLHLPQDLFARGVARFLSLEDRRSMRQASR